MPSFLYTAIDSNTGQQVTVNIEAADKDEANRLVLERGLHPLGVKEKRTNFSMDNVRRIKRKDKILFTNQLSTLINAGLPLMESIKTTAAQTKNKKLKQIATEVSGNIESGSSFSEALGKYPDVFDQIFVNLIKAGEISGSLDVSLERLAVQQEKDGDLISKVKGAMIYPIIVVIVMIAVVVFMLLVVLPSVISFYEEFDKELPWITKALIFLSESLQKYYYIYILATVGFVIGFMSFLKTTTGRSIADSFKLKAPMIKHLFTKLYMARFSRTIGTLFGSGVNLIESLGIISKGINNVHLETSINKSASLVREGYSFSESLSNDPNFLELVPNMIRIGEQSGQTEEMLLKSGEYFEKEVDKQIKALTTMMEPLLILTLGGIAITIVVAILLPIYSIVQESGFGT